MSHRGRKNADEPLAAAIAAGSTIADAAKAAGVSDQTVYRRMREPSFLRRVDEIRREMMSQVVGRLTASLDAAAAQLHNLQANAETDSVKLSACRSIFEFAMRGSELLDVTRRLNEIEAILKGQDGADDSGE